MPAHCTKIAHWWSQRNQSSGCCSVLILLEIFNTSFFFLEFLLSSASLMLSQVCFLPSCPFVFAILLSLNLPILWVDFTQSSVLDFLYYYNCGFIYYLVWISSKPWSLDCSFPLSARHSTCTWMSHWFWDTARDLLYDRCSADIWMSVLNSGN